VGWSRPLIDPGVRSLFSALFTPTEPAPKRIPRVRGTASSTSTRLVASSMRETVLSPYFRTQTLTKTSRQPEGGSESKFSSV
jgi:hypothetical protein